MKRLLLYATATVVLMLVSNGVFGAQAAVTTLSTFDLSNTTAGICKTCGSNPAPPPAPPVRAHLVTKDWRIVSQRNTAPQQVSYSITGEYVNSGRVSQPIEEQLSDNCRRRVTSGGIGISTSLNINIGTTYHCSKLIKINFVVPPRSRTKMYQGNMRYFSELEAAVVEIWSDGSEVMTHQRELGVQQHDYSRYNPVNNPL